MLASTHGRVSSPVLSSVPWRAARPHQPLLVCRSIPYHPWAAPIEHDVGLKSGSLQQIPGIERGLLGSDGFGTISELTLKRGIHIFGIIFRVLR